MKLRMIAFGLVSLVLATSVGGCAEVDDDEEVASLESAAKRRAAAPKFDVRPLGSRERDMMNRHRSAGWLFEKGGMARAKGKTMMGAPAAGNLWIFAVEDGGRTKFRVVRGRGMKTRSVEAEVDIEVDVAVEAASVESSIRPLEGGSCNKQACQSARDAELQACADWLDNSFDPGLSLLYGFAWQKAISDAEIACTGC